MPIIEIIKCDFCHERITPVSPYPGVLYWKNTPYYSSNPGYKYALGVEPEKEKVECAECHNKMATDRKAIRDALKYIKDIGINQIVSRETIGVIREILEKETTYFAQVKDND